ncbi:MAG: HdeD family acid-resistance protein [Geminicoccaceae bacterium]
MDALQKGWGWLLGLGILLSVLGLLLIAAPALGTLAIDLLVGWFLIIGGAAQLFHAFMEKAWRGFLLELLSGVLYLVVGLLLVFYPLAGAQALTIFLAAFLTVEGIVRIALALRVRPAQGWGWLLFGGIVTVILGVLIWVQWPSSALWVIGLLVGINLLFTGWSLTMMAIAVRAHAGRVTAGRR